MVHTRSYKPPYDGILLNTFTNDMDLDAVCVEMFPYPAHIDAWDIGHLIDDYLSAGCRVFLLVSLSTTTNNPYNQYATTNSLVRQYEGFINALSNSVAGNNLNNPRLFIVPSYYGAPRHGETWYKSDAANPSNSIEAVIGYLRSRPEWNSNVNTPHYIGDFDGDGTDDIARIASGTWYIVSGNRESFQKPWSSYSIPGWGGSSDRYFVGDFDGDSRSDIAMLKTNGNWHIVKSNGAAMTGWWGYTVPGWPGDGKYFVGDFDGNGVDDIAHISTNHKWTVVNIDKTYNSVWNNRLIPGWNVTDRYFAGDFDGDSRSDIAMLKPTGQWYIVKFNGAAMTNWWGYTVPGWPGDGKYFIGDFDGNAADDIAHINSSNQWYIVNYDHSFNSHFNGYYIPGWGCGSNYTVADLDGNGTDNLVYLSAGNNGWYAVTELGAPMTNWYPGN